MSKNKKKVTFWKVLGIYCLALALILVAALAALWMVLDSYEASRPENTVAAYMESHDRDYWLSGVENYIDTEAGPFTDRDASLESFGIDPQAEITWTRGNSENGTVWNVRFGKTVVCALTLTEGSDVGFGMNAWEVGEEHYLPSIAAEITIGAPDGATVTVNGITVDAGYMSGRGTLQTELRHDFDLQPEGQLYQVGGLLGPVELKAFDAEGRELDPIQVSATQVHFAPVAEQSFCFLAPEDAVVTVNGFEITGTVCSDVFPNLVPGEVLCYEAKGLFTEPDIRVTVGGEEVSAAELALGQCMFPGASAQIEGELEEFLLGFTKRYVNFISNNGGTYELNFRRMAEYLAEDTEFYTRMFETMFTIKHAHTSNLTYKDMGCSDLVPLGEDRWLVRINYEAEYYFSWNFQSASSENILLLTLVDGKYKVVDMDIPPVTGNAE